MEVQRTIAELYALLADNSSGDISPQDVREIVETLRSGNAEMSLSVSAETSIAAIGTFVKLAGTTVQTANPAARLFSMTANNRLEYTGVAKVIVTVHTNVTLQLSSGVNQDIRTRIAKNGLTITETDVLRLLSGTTDKGFVHCDANVEMVTGDYVEVWVANNTSTANLTALRLQTIVESEAIES